MISAPLFIGILVVIATSLFIQSDLNKRQTTISNNTNYKSTASDEAKISNIPNNLSNQESTNSATKNNVSISINHNIKNFGGSENKQDINNYLYPNATVNNINDNFLEFVSNDSPDEITNWYREKIKSQGMSSKSFVTTNTNGNILNKLVGSKDNIEIRIDITKQTNEKLTSVKISI